MHIKREMYIGKPEVWTTGIPPFLISWDSGNIDEHLEHAGQHMITDLDGNPHKLNDVKDGMMVKIVSRNIHFEGWQYLYTARHSGKYSKACYVSLRQDSIKFIYSYSNFIN